MPKIKTNKTAHKKFRKNSNGKIKRAQANTSHNTAKKSPKTRRKLRGLVLVDKNDLKTVNSLLVK